MLLPIRRSARLGDKFYYNNCPESMNSIMKEVKRQKQDQNPGKTSKCSYSEFIDIANTFVNKYQRNVHRAVKGDGLYMLAPEFKHLEVSHDQMSTIAEKSSRF